MQQRNQYHLYIWRAPPDFKKKSPLQCWKVYNNMSYIFIKISTLCNISLALPEFSRMLVTAHSLYSPITFDERVTFLIQCARSQPCACAFAALYACAKCIMVYANLHANNAANAHALGNDQMRWSQKSYSLVEGNQTIALTFSTLHKVKMQNVHCR